MKLSPRIEFFLFHFEGKREGKLEVPPYAKCSKRPGFAKSQKGKYSCSEFLYSTSSEMKITGFQFE